MEGAFLVLGQVRVGMEWGRAGVFVMQVWLDAVCCKSANTPLSPPDSVFVF